jgi:hypothetical protein
MHRSCLLIVITATLAISRPGLAQDWQLVGLPEGGPLWELEVPDPTGQRAYAVARNHVYRSDDRGDTWTELPTPPPQVGSFVAHLAVSHADPDVLVVLDTDAAYRSTDGGASWSPLPVNFGDTAGLTPGNFTAAAVDPQDANRIAVFRSFLIDGYNQRPYLWQTEDGTTTAIAGPVPLRDPRCERWLFTPTEQVFAASFIQGQLLYQHVYNCEGLQFAGYPAAAHAIRLHSWTTPLLASFSPFYWTSGITGDLVPSPPYLLARGMRELLRIDLSSNQQATLRVSSNGLHAFADGSVVSAEAGAAYRSTDAGITWAPLSSDSLGVNGYQARNFTHVADFSSPPRWLVDNDDGLFASDDNGGHWQFSSSGMSSLPVQALAVDPIDPSRVWFGLGDVRGGSAFPSSRVLYRSSADGHTWAASDLPSKALSLSALVVDPATAAASEQAILYAAGRGCSTGSLCVPGMALGHGIYKSTDAGTSWRQLGAGLPNPPPTPRTLRGISIDAAGGSPQARTVLVASVQGEQGSLVVRSADSGETWTNQVVGLPAWGDNNSFSTATAVVFAPSQAGRAYLATQVTPFANQPVDVQQAGVFRSDDGGLSWSHRSTGLPAHPGTVDIAGVTALAVDPGDADSVWVLSSARGTGTTNLVHRLFRTVDGGLVWSERGDGLPIGNVRAIAIAVDPPGLLCVGGGIGIYCSRDDGASWQPLARQPRWQTLNLAIVGEHLYAATYGGGVQRIQRPDLTDPIFCSGFDPTPGLGPLAAAGPGQPSRMR